MANTSASGGPLQPASSPAPLEGKALNDFFHDLVVNLTGLPGGAVRQRWQTEPPNLPAAFTAWCAVGLTNRIADKFPAVVHNGAGDGTDTLHRHEILEVLASFYDTGTVGKADEYATLLRDNLAIAQNREVLLLAGMGLIEVGELVSVPVLMKSRWLYRVDVPFNVRREVVRTYPVENLLSLDGTIQSDSGLTASISKGG